jgi:hypothetical protein
MPIITFAKTGDSRRNNAYTEATIRKMLPLDLTFIFAGT